MDNFSNGTSTNPSFKTPPPSGTLPIVQRFISAYKLWGEFVIHFPKKHRYTLGEKVDSLFIETLELLFIASYIGKEQKLPYLQKASGKFDLLKFFLQIAWELKAIDTKKYAALSKELDAIGKMLGGWARGIQNKTPLR